MKGISGVLRGNLLLVLSIKDPTYQLFMSSEAVLSVYVNKLVSS